MWLWKNLTILMISCFIAVFSTSVYADKAQWELGVGLAGLDIPFYPGWNNTETVT